MAQKDKEGEKSLFGWHIIRKTRKYVFIIISDAELRRRPSSRKSWLCYELIKIDINLYRWQMEKRETGGRSGCFDRLIEDIS